MYNFLQEQGKIYSSKSFRRLGEKNQIVANFEDKNPHISNRLTHSLEVGIVAKMISEKLPTDLHLDPDQIFNICLLHDIGHPSLGHFLEEKLNNILKDKGYYFEGNANNFVIIEKEDIKLSKKTFASLAKYPQELTAENKKGIYSFHFQKIIHMVLEVFIAQQRNFFFNGYANDNKEFVKYIQDNLINKTKITNRDLNILKEKFPGKNIRTIESKIMETADDIAYLTHDLTDFLIHKSQQLKKTVVLKELVDLNKYDNNPNNKYFYILDSDNAESVSNTIRKTFINNVSFDFLTGELFYINKEIEDFKLILRKLLLEEFIYPECDLLEEKFRKEDIQNKYFEKIKDKEFIKEIVISRTYRDLINNTNDIGKKYRYMANYLAEKTDKWLF